MALTVAELQGLLTLDDSQFRSGVRSAKGDMAGMSQTAARSGRDIDAWGQRFTRVGAGMVATGALLAKGLWDASQAATGLGEAVNASSVVFGDAGSIIDDYADGAAENMGLSERAFRESTTQMGAMLKNLGFDQEQAAESSARLTQRSADMASVFNTDVTEATQAVGAALRGEADPIERFGVSVNAAAVNAKAMEMGLVGATGELNANAKALAIEAIILEQTNDLAGDFADTNDSLANRQRVLSARMEDFQAKLGEGVLPAMEALLGTGLTLLEWMSELDAVTGGTVGKLAGFAAVGLVAMGGLSLLIGQAIRFRDNISAAGDAISGFNRRIGGVRRAAALAAGGAGLAGLVLTVRSMAEASREAQLDKLAEQLAAVTDTSDEAAVAAVGVAAEFGNAGAASERLNGLWERTLEMGAEQAERFLEMAEAAGVNEEQLDEWRAALERKQAADAQAAVDQERNTEAVEEGTEALEDQAEEYDNAADAAKAYNDQLQALLDPLFGMVDALQSNEEAQRAVVDAEAALRDARQEHGASSDEAAEAERNLRDAQFEAAASAQDMEMASNELTASVADGSTEIDEARLKLARWVDQGLITQQTADVVALGFAGARRQAEEYEGDYTADIRAEDRASGMLDLVRQQADRLDGRTAHVTVVAQVRQQLGVFADIIGFGGQRQHGGAVTGDRLYEVAEGGPELLEQGGRTYLLPGSDGRVIPAGAFDGQGLAGMPGGQALEAWTDIARTIVDAIENQTQTLVDTDIVHHQHLIGWLQQNVQRYLDWTTNGIETLIRMEQLGAQNVRWFEDLNSIPRSRKFHSGGRVDAPRGTEVEALLTGQERVLAADDPLNRALSMAESSLVSSLPPAGGRHAGKASGGGGTARVTIDLTGGDDGFLRWLRDRVRVDGGGSVQVALGQDR